MPRNARSSKPLTPATFHILLSLTGPPIHGYRIKRMVEDRTDGSVRLGAGTLYAGIRRMVENGLIEEREAPADADVEPGARWRFYAITEKGRTTLDAELDRMSSDLEAARSLLDDPSVSQQSA